MAFIDNVMLRPLLFFHTARDGGNKALGMMYQYLSIPCPCAPPSNCRIE